MANNYLPPQAYTREDVAKAYVWVQSQPDYVKNMATNKETLVALYLQARRNGVSSLENIAPVSSRDFKTQLASLANELNQFEKPKEQLKPQPQHVPPQIPQTPEFIERNDFEERSIEFKVSEKRIPQQDNFILDPKSQQIVDAVKSHLNLESDREVVRMLISLGFEKIRTIFPQS